MSDMEKLADAIAALACAQAEANKLQARLWDNLKPSTRARLLGISTSAERKRRQQARLNPKPL